MPKFRVELMIYNKFTVEAETAEEAQEKVQALGGYETLDGADYEVTEVMEDADA